MIRSVCLVDYSACCRSLSAEVAAVVGVRWLPGDEGYDAVEPDRDDRRSGRPSNEQLEGCLN